MRAATSKTNGCRPIQHAKRPEDRRSYDTLEGTAESSLRFVVRRSDWRATLAGEGVQRYHLRIETYYSALEKRRINDTASIVVAVLVPRESAQDGG
jgi:hypothetical protein